MKKPCFILSVLKRGKSIAALILILAFINPVLGQPDWSTTGNTLLTGIEYIGTNSAHAFNIKVNGNNPSGRIDFQSPFTTSFGYQTMVVNTGINNSAFGYRALNANMNGGSNTAIGSSALQNNTAGGKNTACGNAALASNIIGLSNAAYGVAALQNNITGSNNTAIGNSTLQNNVGDNNTAIGALALLTNNFGKYNTAVGMGADVTLPGLTNATAIGFNAKVSQSNSLVLGGTGPSSVNVGIGTTTPFQKLHVDNGIIFVTGSNSFGGPMIVLGGGPSTSSPNGEWGIEYAPADQGLNFWRPFPAPNFGNYFLFLANNGRIGMGTSTPQFTLEVNGLTQCQGNIWTSDERFKRNIDVLPHNLEKIKKLQGVAYYWKKDQFPRRNFDERKQIGFIAQEMEKVFPELVYTDDSSFKSINYIGIIPVLTEAMKEQQVQIESRDEKIAELQQQMAELIDMVHNCCAVPAVEPQGSKSGNVQPSNLEGNRLDQNIPNPFSENTIIRYYVVQQASESFIKITSLEGLELATFPITAKGNGQILISGNSLPAGTYLYELIVNGEKVATKKMVLTR